MSETKPTTAAMKAASMLRPTGYHAGDLDTCPKCLEWAATIDRETGLPSLLAALKDLREAATEAYKAGRIPAEPFVRAGNVIAAAEGR